MSSQEAMMHLSSSHSKRPAIHDLFTMQLSGTDDMWYRLGLELGLSIEELDTIKTAHLKPLVCKKEMFKKWLKICPEKQCTWSYLLQALAKVDLNLAISISQTISTESDQSDETETVTQFPIISKIHKKDDIENVDTTKSLVSTSTHTTLTDESRKRDRPQTEIISRLSEKPLLLASMRKESEAESVMKQANTTSNEPTAFALKSPQERSYQSDEIRSASADTFQTADEDETVQPLKFSYQHNEDSLEQGMPTRIHQLIYDAINLDNVETVKLLISKGRVTPHVRLLHGRSLLIYATQQRSKEVVAFLLKTDGFNSLKDVDDEGAMAIFFAISEDCYEIAKLIINQHSLQGIGVNLLVKETPLIIYPAAKGFHKTCELLLENRANPDLRNKNGETALIVAASHGHKEVVQVLLKFNANILIISKKTCRTALEEAISCGHTETVKLLVEASAAAKANDLKLFLCKTREEIVQLIKAGAIVNTRRSDETTPLMIHAEKGSLDLVQELLFHDAHVDLQDEAGDTALIKASAHGHTEVVDTLLESGVILNLKNAIGRTALAVAVLHQQPKVMNRLLLAGADIGIRDEDGNTIEDLAKTTNNHIIIEAIIRQNRSSLTQERKFVDLLSSHLHEQRKTDATKQKENKLKASKKEALLKKMPKSLRAQEDKESTLKKELEKAYERIGVLETRVGDLTLQLAKETPSEEDLAKFDRPRVEIEFRKIKELKRKAEQFAIEAKQMAQRLSAENFKLREDLSKEHHHNELLHKSIVREMEDIVDKSASLEERTQAKLEAFQFEVNKRARQLALTSANEPKSLGILHFNLDEIKKLIFKHSLKISHSVVVVTGLPFSGKSTLFNRMLRLEDKASHNISKLPGLSVTEAAVMVNPYQPSENSPPWLSAINKEDAELLMFAACLTQVCSKGNQSLATLGLNKADGEVSRTLTKLSEPFKMPLANEYFEKAFSRLGDLCTKLQEEGNLSYLQNASLVFMNVWDVGVNRAVNEIISLIGRRCKNLILLNVLSLEKDAMTLNERVDLRNHERYCGSYSARKDDERVLQSQRAGDYYVWSITTCKCQPNSCVLIGTYKDSFKEDDWKKVADLCTNVKYIVGDKLTDLGFAKDIHPHLLTVDARSEEDARKVCTTIENMIIKDSRFERTVPLTWIMLRGVLQATEQLFLPKSELLLYANECGIQTSEELDSWLDLFQSCLSIIYSPDDSVPSLHDSVIIHPFKFVQCLDSLFYAEFNDEFQSDPKLKLHLDLMKKGILTDTFAQKIWPNDPNTTSHKDKGENVKCNYMLRVIMDLKISSKLDLAIFSDSDELHTYPTEHVYYVPSLGYTHSQVSIQSNSLIIIASHIHEATCNIYSEFLSFVQQQEKTKESLKFVADEYCDILYLKWVENAVLGADIYFRVVDGEDLVELCVTCTASKKFTVHESHVLLLQQKLCSIMKTICVEFFHKFSQIVPNMSFKLAVVSQTCLEDGLNKVHVVPFEILGDQTQNNLACFTCGRPIASSQLSLHQSVWINCAYQGSPYHTVSARDTLSRSELISLAEDLYGYSSPLIAGLAKRLGIQSPEIESLKQYCTSDDFPLLILLEWKKRHRVASRPRLARALLENGLTSLAVKLDETIENTTSVPHLQLSECAMTMKTIISSTITQHLPHKRWREIGERLAVPNEDLQLIVQAKSQDKSVFHDIIYKWLHGRSESESLQILVDVLNTMDMHSIADMLKATHYSKNDLLWLK